MSAIDVVLTLTYGDLAALNPIEFDVLWRHLGIVVRARAVAGRAEREPQAIRSPEPPAPAPVAEKRPRGPRGPYKSKRPTLVAEPAVEPVAATKFESRAAEAAARTWAERH